MSDVVLTGCFTLAGVIVGALITNLWEGSREKRRLAFEEHRWRNDRLLQREIECFTDLHTSLVECERSFNTYLMQKGALTSEALHQDLIPKRNEFSRRLGLASLYLNRTDEQRLNAVDGQFIQALKALEVALATTRPHDFDDTLLIERASGAKEFIRRRLKPTLQNSS